MGPQKLFQSRQIIRVNQVNIHGQQFAPDRRRVRRRPKTDAASLLVRFCDQLGKFPSFCGWEWSDAFPTKNTRPVVTDERDEILSLSAI